MKLTYGLTAVDWLGRHRNAPRASSGSAVLAVGWLQRLDRGMPPTTMRRRPAAQGWPRRGPDATRRAGRISESPEAQPWRGIPPLP